MRNDSNYLAHASQCVQSAPGNSPVRPKSIGLHWINDGASAPWKLSKTALSREDTTTRETTAAEAPANRQAHSGPMKETMNRLKTYIVSLLSARNHRPCSKPRGRPTTLKQAEHSLNEYEKHFRQQSTTTTRTRGNTTIAFVQ